MNDIYFLSNIENMMKDCYKLISTFFKQVLHNNNKSMKVHTTLYVMYQVSFVTPHVSPITLQFFYPLKILDIGVELVGGGSVINGAYPV